MTKTVRSRYTLEFKQEAVRLVQLGQSIAAVSRSLGVVEQNLLTGSRPAGKTGSLVTCSGSLPVLASTGTRIDRRGQEVVALGRLRRSNRSL